MAVDIRASITCSLGPLISASVSDDFIQGSGLIKTTGSCEIAAIIYPPIGTTVSFEYTRNGVTRKVPRMLKVLSSFADPFRRITSVELGCQFTYMQGLREPIDWTAFDDPENDGATAEDASIVVLPIHASSIAQQCLNVIGLSGSTPLTNKFSISSFDFSSGYVQILSDLLVSECYCGYIDVNGEFKVFSLLDPPGSTRLILGSEIIDAGPIGVGDIPGESVVVNYSTLKLNNPDPDETEDDVLKRNWEYEEQYGSETEVILDGIYNSSGDEWTNYYKYIPKTITSTVYDSWDRVTKRKTVEKTILAEGNPDYCKELINFFGNGPIGYQILEKVSETVITYKKEAPLLDGQIITIDTSTLEEGYDEVLAEVTTTYLPEVLLFSGIAGNYYNAEENDIIQLGLTELHIASRSTTFSQTYSRDLTVRGPNGTYKLGSFPITKTVDKSEVIFGQTVRGQRYIAEKTANGKMFNEIKGYAGRVVDGGTQTRVFSGREATFQGRPRASDRAISSLADGGDPNNGYQTESSSEIELVFGAQGAMRRTEFSLPYAPDDIFIREEGPTGVTYTSVASDAPQKANNYGRVQNALLMGSRYGINLQLPADCIPPVPYSPIAIQANGLTGVYATNAISWTMDANGIIASTDALLLGASSQA